MAEILIIEDDERLAGIIRRGLEEEGYATSVAFDGETGLKLALEKKYSLIISDIILPKINGLDLCREIRIHKPDIPIIMLTALGTTDDKVEGFDSGADDYLVKPFEFRELSARIRSLLKRADNQIIKKENVLKYADIEMNNQTKTVKRNNIEINLTPKEFNLLRYFLENPEKILSRTEISENVWDTHYDTGTNFIDVYINYLRTKIDKPFVKKLIHTRAGMGFMLYENA